MGNVDTGNSPLPSLGNLAHAARHGKLKQARSILIGLGLLMLVVNGFLIALAKERTHEVVAKEVADLGRQGLVIEPAELAELEAAAVRWNQLYAAGVALVGGLFIVFGFIIYRFPVPITIVSLVLYIGIMAINAVLDPATIAQGIIIKIIVIAGLLSAIRAALAYEHGNRAAALESAG